MEKINIDFSGYMECDKDDVVINMIKGDGEFEKVDTKKLTAKSIIEGVKDGIYYLSFRATYSKQLDGDVDFNLELDDE